jgi:hypothetical protein
MFTVITDFFGADARVLTAANILLVVANMALLLRISFRPSRCYDQVLKMLADEQGDWYIEKVLGHELAKILKHNTRDMDEVPEDEDDEDDDDDEDDEEGDDDEDDDVDEDDEDEDDEDEDDDELPSLKRTKSQHPRVAKDPEFFTGSDATPESPPAGASAPKATHRGRVFRKGLLCGGPRKPPARPRPPRQGRFPHHPGTT